MARKVIAFRKQALQMFLGREPSTDDLEDYRFNFFVEGTEEHLKNYADVQFSTSTRHL